MGLLIFGILSSVGYTVAVGVWYEPQLFTWLHQLVATLVTAIVAFATAVLIYYRQVRDRDRNIRAMLDSYLDYLIEVVKPSDDPGIVTYKRISTTVIPEVITSGILKDIVPNLIRLQSMLETYKLFAYESMIRSHLSGSEVHPREKSNIDSAATGVLDEALRCKTLLAKQA